MVPIEELSEPARETLFGIMECFRERILPGMEKLRWRDACVTLIWEERVSIYQHGDKLRITATSKGFADPPRDADQRLIVAALVSEGLVETEGKS